MQILLEDAAEVSCNQIIGSRLRADARAMKRRLQHGLERVQLRREMRYDADRHFDCGYLAGRPYLVRQPYIPPELLLFRLR